MGRYPVGRYTQSSFKTVIYTMTAVCVHGEHKTAVGVGDDLLLSINWICDHAHYIILCECVCADTAVTARGTYGIGF